MGRNRPASPIVAPVRPLDRWDVILLLALTVLAFGVRAWRLDFPQEQYFDEIYYVKAAQDYLDFRPDSNTVHPPLGKIQIAAGMLLADRVDALMGPDDDVPDSAEWRLTSMIAGTLMVPLTFMLGFRLSRGNRTIAGLAAFLVTVDFMALAVSRISMLDMVLSLWILVGIYCGWRYIEEAGLHSPRRWEYALMAALAFGVATACKWNGLFGGFGACVAMMLFGTPQSTDLGAEPPRPTQRERLLRWVGPPLLMALLIPVVYILSYTVLFLQEGTLGQAAWDKIYGFHKLMITFRYDPEQFKHRYLSYFWSWPLVLRPIWLFYKADAGMVSGIVAFGSIVFWWTSLLYMFEIGFFAVVNRDRACGFLVILYLSQWLLWASSVTGGFIYYMLPAVPLMALATATVLDDWHKTGGRWLVWLYMAVITLFFVLYFPFLTAYPAEQRMFDFLFPSWAGQWR